MISKYKKLLIKNSKVKIGWEKYVKFYTHDYKKYVKTKISIN